MGKGLYLTKMRREREVVVYTDGATGAGGEGAGLGVVIRRPGGEILAWAGRRLGPMTNNEAEYRALILGLETVRRYRPQMVRVFSDSEVLVKQMQGLFAVRSAALKPLHRRACHLARHFRRVTYTHVPREENRLADALAGEALQGQVTSGK